MKAIITIFMMLMAGLTMLALISGPVAAVAIPATIDTDMDITVNTTWDSGTCDLSANITVKSGAKLTLYEVTIIIDVPGNSSGGGGGNNSSLMSPMMSLTKYFGLRVESGGSLVIQNSTIRGKTSDEEYNIVGQGTLNIYGSTIKNLDYYGIFFDADDGVPPKITDSYIIDSEEGIQFYNIDSTIIRNHFSNIGYRAVYLYDGTHTVSNNTLTDVNNYGIYFDSADQVYAADNVINDTNDGITGYDSNCNLDRNEVGVYDDGIYLYQCDCLVRNNTVYGISQGDDGIYARYTSGHNRIYDNEIYNFYMGVYFRGSMEASHNRIYDVDFGIYGTASNYLMNNSNGNPKFLWNNISDARYSGINIYSTSANIENNTISSIGDNWNYGNGLSLESYNGDVFNNDIKDIKGTGIAFRSMANILNIANNRLTNIKRGSAQMHDTGAVWIGYSDQWREWNLYPDGFIFSNVDVVFTANTAGILNLYDFNLTGDQIGNLVDIYIFSEWSSSVVNTYDVLLDNYQMNRNPWDQQKSEINIHWSSIINAQWESDQSPIDDGEMTVLDKNSNEVYFGCTDFSGWSEKFYVQQMRETMDSGGSNISRANTKTEYGPFNFYLQKQVGQRTYFNSTEFDIKEPMKEIMVIDNVPPILEITSPDDGFLTNQTNIEVTGLTETFSKVSINGVNVTTYPNGTFKGLVDLPEEGDNIISVTSTDKGDNVVSTSFIVVRDTTLPIIILNTPEQSGIYNTLYLTVLGKTEENCTVTVQGEPVVVEMDGAFETVVNITKEGINEVIVTSTDLAGNMRTKLVNFTIDVTPPPLVISKPVNNSITRLPTADIKGSTENTATVKVNDQVIFFENIIFETMVELAEGENTITIVATDVAGNTRTAIITVLRDSTPPLLNITSPTPNLRTSRNSVSVVGETDVDASVTVNGIGVKNDNGTFTDIVFLDEGSNRITVEATDPAGNVVTKVIKVYKEAGTAGPSDPISVTSPVNNTVTTESTITIKGSVNELGFLMIDGENVTVGDDDTFEQVITLNEGDNIIDLYLVDDMNNTYHVSWHITLDTTPPAITITEPDAKVKQSNVLVKGVTEPGAMVTVNGLIVYVSKTGEFTAPVTLNPGKNTILVTAVDEAGNVGTQEVEVKYEEEVTGGVGTIESGAGLGLLAAMLVIMLVVMIMMAMMMARMKAARPKEDLLPKEDEEEEDEEEEEDKEGSEEE